MMDNSLNNKMHVFYIFNVVVAGNKSLNRPLEYDRSVAEQQNDIDILNDIETIISNCKELVCYTTPDEVGVRKTW